jgi:exodeoxyribonuclease VII large subunit
MKIAELSGRLHALSPAAVLDRGFSIVRTLPDKTIISDADAVSIGQILEILLAKGGLHCRVEKKEPSHGQKNDV